MALRQTRLSASYYRMGNQATPILDGHIRRALIKNINERDRHAAIINEMPLRLLDGRADVAAINGSMSGFEIKSQRDSLARLPTQVLTYETVFDYCHVVVDQKHLVRARKIIPRNWGLWVAKLLEEEVSIEQLRKGHRNTRTSLEALVKLMWKDELVATLLANNIPARSSEPIRAIWEKAFKLPKEAAARAARQAIAARATARSDS